MDKAPYTVQSSSCKLKSHTFCQFYNFVITCPLNHDHTGTHSFFIVSIVVITCLTLVTCFRYYLLTLEEKIDAAPGIKW